MKPRQKPVFRIQGVTAQGHPASRYFSVGRIGRDQVEDYAGRRGMELGEAERWLGPNLGYEPEGGSAPGANGR